MAEYVGEQFILRFDADDSGVQNILNQIINTAAKGVTVGISMDADVTKVVKKIEEVSNVMQQKIGSGTFDFNELFNLKSAIGELGNLSKKFKDLSPIFNALNDGANNLTASMTQIASLKLDASQFSSLKQSLENIDTSIQNISNKLDGVSSSSGVQKVAKEAKEVAVEMDKAAHATDELGKKQKALGSVGTTPVGKVAKSPINTNNSGVDASNGALKERLGTLELTEDSLRTIIALFKKMEASLSSIKKIFVDVGDGAEFSPLLSAIDQINASIHELNLSTKNIGLNMNVDVDSTSVLDKNFEEKSAKALIAYQRLFEQIKMSGAGGAAINDAFFGFDLSNFDSTLSKVKALYTFIEKARQDAKNLNGGRDVLKQSIDSKYWTQASAALRQMTIAENQIKAAGDTNGLENLFAKTDLTEVLNQLRLIVINLEEISASALEFKNIFKEGFNVSSQLEEISKLTNKIKELETELSKVKSGNGITAKTTTTGANGEQLALESTLHKTYELQDIIATTLLSVDESITKISNAASTKLIPVLDAINEKIKVNGSDAIASAKAQQQAIKDTARELNNTNSKTKKTGGSGSDLDAVTKSSYAELTKLTKQVYAEKQAIAKLDAKNNANEIAARQAIIASRQEEIDIIREGQHYYGLTQGQEEAAYRQLRANLEQQLVLTKGKTSDKTAQTQEKQYITQLNAHYADYVNKLKEAQILRAKRDEMRPLASDEDMAAITEKIIVAEEKLTAAWRVVRDEFAKDPFAKTHISAKLLQSELEAASISAEKLTGQEIIDKYHNARKIVSSGLHSTGFINTKDAQEVQKLISTVKELDVLIDQVGANGIAESEENQQKIFETIKALENLKRNVNVYEAFEAGAYNTYNKKGAYAGHLTDLSQDSELSGLKGQVDSGAITQKAALEQVAASIAKAKVEVVDYSEATGQLTARFRDQQKNLQQITVGFQDVGNATRHNIKPIEQYQSAFNKMFSGVGKKLKELLRYFSAFTIVMRVINTIKNGIQTVRELDTALTELKIVTGSTTGEMAKFHKQAQQVASAIAGTTLEVTKSATEWSRLGLIK